MCCNFFFLNWCAAGTDPQEEQYGGGWLVLSGYKLRIFIMKIQGYEMLLGMAIMVTEVGVSMLLFIWSRMRDARYT